MWLLLWALLASAGEPSWSLDLGQAARLTPVDGGLLLAALPDAVQAIDVRSGAILWRREVGEVVTADLVRAVPEGRYLQLSRVVAGAPDTYEVLDTHTGRSLWQAEEGEVLLDVFASGGSPAVLLVDRKDEPGSFALVGLTEPPWRQRVIGSPAVLPARPGRGVQTYTARANLGPLFLEDALITAWSPGSGVVRRSLATGEVAWRVLLPGAERLLPASGDPDLVRAGDLIVVPQRARQVTALGLDGRPRWKPSKGKAKAPIHLVAASPTLVWTGAGPFLEALARPDGRRLWRVQASADLVALYPLDARVAALDRDGTLVVLDALGTERARFELELGADPRLVRRGDLLLVTHERGVVALRPWAGTVAWQVGPAGGLDLSRPSPTAHGAAPPWMDRRGPGAYHLWTEGDLVHRTHLGTGVDRQIDTGGSGWVADPGGSVVVVQRPGGLLVALPFEALPSPLTQEQWDSYDEQGLAVVEVPVVPTEAATGDRVTVVGPVGVAPAAQSSLQGTVVAVVADEKGGWAQIAVPLEVASLLREGVARGEAYELRR